MKHLIVIALLISYLTGSYAFAWELSGVWGHKIGIKNGQKLGTVVHTVGDQEESLWVMVQCAENVSGLHFLVSVGPDVTRSSATNIKLSLSVDGHKAIERTASHISEYQYVVEPSTSDSLIPRLINGSSIKVGVVNGTNQIEYFKADLEGFSTAIENSCSWHDSFNSYTSKALSFTGSNEAVKPPVETVKSHNSRGDWQWSNDDDVIIARTNNKENETGFAYVCFKSNGLDCNYIFQTEFSCEDRTEYRVTFSFSGGDWERDRIKNKDYEFDAQTQNRATGVCGSNLTSSYIVIAVPELEQDELPGNSILSRLKKESNVLLGVVNNNGDKHASRFSLHGSQKAIAYVRHKSDSYYLNSLFQKVKD